jgi:hypothetical protein
MTGISGTSSSMSSSSVRGSFLSTEFAIAMATFGISTALVTASMKRYQRQRSSSELERHVTTSTSSSTHHYLYHPPSRLVQYLRKHGGKKWEHYTEEVEEFVRECPKVELHVHLDGSLDPDFLWHCLQKYDDNGEGWISCLPVSTTLPWDPKHPLPVQ